MVGHDMKTCVGFDAAMKCIYPPSHCGVPTYIREYVIEINDDNHGNGQWHAHAVN